MAYTNLKSESIGEESRWESIPRLFFCCGGTMLEMDDSENLKSKVEDSELIAILSLYEELSAIEAISIKDLLLYKGDEDGGPTGDATRAVQFRSDLEYGSRIATRIPKNKRREA